MSSSTMPPPPSPLAHRRTRPSSSTAAGPSLCFPRKMSLSKADTFHQPSSPSTEDDPVVSVAHLAKRSTTYTRSSFASWLYSGREAANDVIADFEQTFSGARGPRPAARRRSAREFEDLLLAKAQHRAASPVDSGIGSSIGSPSERNLSKTLDKALDLTSHKDSALGDSVSSSLAGHSKTLIQDANSTEAQRPTRSSRNPTELTIIRYPIPPSKKSSQPLLGNLARRQIYKRLFAPLLRESRFEDFKPIVAGTRKNKNLRCLRDIEQALINQPVTLSVTPAEYRSFAELSIQLVIDTYQHLSEAEQRRPIDRAYDNGYFLDLVQQVQQLAAHIGSSNTTVEDGSEPTADDGVTLEGGLSETGNLAELVRWKNGEGISLRTGLPYLPMAGMKRSASSAACDDAQLSARRKKGVEYPVLHLPCNISGCDKVFSRSCDLAKHEKTHTRPYKCPEPGCKFHEHGLPTEKELDRHRNDKHNTAPKLYSCNFCEFKTKRESNCKQHMEKKHDWTYQRSKGKDKIAGLTPKATPKTPALSYSVGPSPASQNWDAQSLTSSMHESPYEQPMHDVSFGQEYPNPLFPRPSMTAFNQGNQLDLNTNFTTNGFDSGAYPTPASAVQQRFTPRTPAYSAITPSPMMMVDHNVPNFAFNSTDMPTPESMPSHSRHPSMAQELPQSTMMDYSNNMDMSMDFDMSVGMNGMDGGLLQDDFQLISGTGNAFTRQGAGDATLFPEIQDFPLENNYHAGAFAAVDFNQFDDEALFWGEN